MKALWNKIFSTPNYLVSQLFLYFGLVLTAILFISLAITSLDARQITPLLDKDISFLTRETDKLQKRYDLDEIFERDLSIQTPSGLDLILVEKNTNIVSGMNQFNIRQFLSFLYQTEGESSPMARSFDNIRINGPFPLSSERREYNVYFLYPVKAQSDWFNYILDNPIILVVILLLAGLPAIFILAWHITRPVKALRLTANAVARGTLITNEDIENQGIQEFRDVGKSLNHMIASLQNLNNHQQRLLSDISHELKTPLARLQLATAILKKKNGETKETERIESEIEKMNIMVLDLLTLSRQQINQHLTRSVFPIINIWEKVLEDALFETEQNGIELMIEHHIDHPEDYYINGNHGSLTSALENIIRNAQKYAKSRIKVVTCLKDNNERLVISIDDDGQGVPETELDKIFKPFYRVDEARARQTGGTGLGLAIVENAITQHKGSVIASKSDMGGLHIEITLPLWHK